MKNSGFTLVEISIVITIIALILGGIFTAQSMLDNARLRSIISDAQKYDSAVAQFRTKYQSLPGDFRAATRFWGARAGGTADGTDATCQAYFDTTQTPTSLTCNGNGDGLITQTNWVENWSLWQHLANAGLIEGQFTGQGAGTATANLREGVTEVNCPHTRYGNAGFAYTYLGVASGHVSYLDGDYGTVLRIGMDTNVDDPFMTAANMSALDSKFDDGLPGKGTIRAYRNSARPNCTTTDDPETAIYNIAATALGCNIVRPNNF